MLFISAIIGFTSCEKADEPGNESSGNKATEYIVDGNKVTINDHGKGTGNKTLTADKIWILDGMVYVNNGQNVQFIEPYKYLDLLLIYLFLAKLSNFRI